MPRNARVLSKTGIYHVMLRGNERKDIFCDEEDKEKFLALLYAKKEDDGCLLYAYCVMDNHVHLVLKEGKAGISTIMKRIGTSYAKYFNGKYERVGHLFQDRYKSENIENESYLFTVIRYIHKNPEHAGIAKTEEYPWSSYPAYIRGPGGNWMPETAEILRMFSETPDTALAMFREFHSESDIERCMDIEEDLVDKKTQVHEYMDQFLRNNGLAFGDLDKVEYVPIRKEMVLMLKEHTALSGRKLAELTGVNREIIRKILSDGM